MSNPPFASINISSPFASGRSRHFNDGPRGSCRSNRPYVGVRSTLVTARQTRNSTLMAPLIVATMGDSTSLFLLPMRKQLWTNVSRPVSSWNPKATQSEDSAYTRATEAVTFIQRPTRPGQDLREPTGAGYTTAQTTPPTADAPGRQSRKIRVAESSGGSLRASGLDRLSRPEPRQAPPRLTPATPWTEQAAQEEAPAPP